MGKLKSVALNFAINFLVAFGIATYFRNRQTGLKAGLALGVVAAAAVLLGGDSAEELAENVETELDVESATEA